jgi:pimeloyl-ACP methyl ester carboxylesterase
MTAKKIAIVAALLLLAACAALLRARARLPAAPTTGITSVATARGRLRVDDVGRDGIPVLFVHASGADRRAFAAQLAELRARRRAIAVDLPGAGESPPPRGGDASPTAVAGDLAAAADALSLERLVLVCQGDSRSACLAFATLEPARIAALLFVDPPASPPWPPPRDAASEPPTLAEAAVEELPRRAVPAAALAGALAESLTLPDASVGGAEPAMTDARFRALEPFARGALEEACPMLAAAAAAAPQDGVSSLALARCEVRRGRKADAVAAALDAVRRGPYFVRARAYALLADALGYDPTGESQPRPALGCSTRAWSSEISLTEGTADPPIAHRTWAVISETEEARDEVRGIEGSRCGETLEDCPLGGVTLGESVEGGPALGLCDSMRIDGEEDAAAGCFAEAAARSSVARDAVLLFVDPCRHVAALRDRRDTPWGVTEETYEPYQVGSVKEADGRGNAPAGESDPAGSSP